MKLIKWIAIIIFVVLFIRMSLPLVAGLIGLCDKTQEVDE